jgi:hypothetical protein
MERFIFLETLVIGETKVMNGETFVVKMTKEFLIGESW